METNKENTKILEKIYWRTLKARDVYQNAAKNVHNRPLTGFFENAAIKHDEFAVNLKSDLSEDIDKKSPMDLKTDEFWSDFASIIVRRNESAMLKNCLSAERKAIEMYDQALERSDLEEQVKNKVRQQRDYATQLYKEVEDLEKQYASD